MSTKHTTGGSHRARDELSAPKGKQNDIIAEKWLKSLLKQLPSEALRELKALAKAAINEEEGLHHADTPHKKRHQEKYRNDATEIAYISDEKPARKRMDTFLSEKKLLTALSEKKLPTPEPKLVLKLVMGILDKKEKKNPRELVFYNPTKASDRHDSGPSR